MEEEDPDFPALAAVAQHSTVSTKSAARRRASVFAASHAATSNAEDGGEGGEEDGLEGVEAPRGRWAQAAASSAAPNRATVSEMMIV